MIQSTKKQKEWKSGPSLRDSPEYAASDSPELRWTNSNSDSDFRFQIQIRIRIQI